MSDDHFQLSTHTVVDVHAIEQQLAEVRWGHGPNGDMGEAAEHAAAEARASVLNLITVVVDERQLDHVMRVLDRLSITHPSRTLILLAQEDRPSTKLEAQVTAETRTESGHRVTTERVVLHAHGEVATHLASLATPLVIQDLPVMVWWPGKPHFGSGLFDDLCALGDRLVVDTDDDFEAADFVELLKVSRQEHNRVSIGDFNWARLIPWRHLAAQFFDMPGMLGLLAQLQGVTIHHGSDRRTAQARLLAGWIQSRMATVGLEVPVELRPDENLEHGVSRMLMYCREGNEIARFGITRLAGGRLSAEVRVGDYEPGARTVRLESRPPEELLAIELMLPGHDVLYEEALAALVR